jgi:hypothetical protein
MLLDEAAILACAMYVDLNPIRAAIAQSLEDSDFTGAKSRVDDLKDSDFKTELDGSSGPTKSKTICAANPVKPKRTRRWERSQGRTRSGWLSPMEVSESADPIGPDPSSCGRRASLKGFIPMSVLRYLELLDWTGRQLRSDKRGAIPEGIAPILSRLGIESGSWLDLASKFGRLFKRAAGSSISLSAEADRRGQSWMQGPGSACLG